MPNIHDMPKRKIKEIIALNPILQCTITKLNKFFTDIIRYYNLLMYYCVQLNYYICRGCTVVVYYTHNGYY